MVKKDKDELNNNIEILKQQIKCGRPGTFYIFHGEEAFSREYYLKELRSILLDELTEEFNFHRFTAETIDVHAVSESIEAMPMMAERSLVQIDDVNFCAMDENERNGFSAVFSDIPDYCTVVLNYDAIDFKIDGRQKNLARALSGALDVEFRKLTEKDLAAWIEKQFRKDGKIISSENALYLIRRTDGLMTTLVPEIEKIVNYSCHEEISSQAIDAVVDPVLEAAVFDMIDEIASGHFEHAMSMLSVLLCKEECIKVLGAISSQFRTYLYASVLSEAGKKVSDMAAFFKVSDYRAKFILQTVKKMPRGFCEKAVLLCEQTDCSLKSMQGNDTEMMEFLLLKLAEDFRNA